MGAKTWMLVQADCDDVAAALRKDPQPDRQASAELARVLFPKDKLTPMEDGDLSYTNPPDDELYIGCFRGGVSVIAAKEFGIDRPSQLDARFLRGRNVYFHAMHSVVDWLAFAKWKDGKLVRALSLAPDHGIIEDLGARLPFELDYWDGKHPATPGGEEPYAFPFHPLDLGEAALKEFFGYQIEGMIDAALLEAETIPLLSFKRSRSRWKFW